jgi:3-isopropylmalate dehydratase small subunit
MQAARRADGSTTRAATPGADAAVRKLPTVVSGTGPRFVREVGRLALMLGARGDGIVPEALIDERNVGAPFLVARADLDVGDVPENAVARLLSLGVRAVFAPGFERMFYGHCLSHGVLPAMIDEALAARMGALCESGSRVEITVDLERQTIDWPGTEPSLFEVDARARNKLLLGLTDLEETLRHARDITALRAADRNRRPWLYAPPE